MGCWWWIKETASPQEIAWWPDLLCRPRAEPENTILCADSEVSYHLLGHVDWKQVKQDLPDSP